MEGESNLTKRIPEPVLVALEGVIAQRNAAVARLAVGDPVDAMEATRRLEQSVRGCLVAAISLVRHDEHSRRDWEALKANDSLINDIVDVINHQVARMREPLAGIDTERLSALRELDGMEPVPVLRTHD